MKNLRLTSPSEELTSRLRPYDVSRIEITHESVVSISLNTPLDSHKGKTLEAQVDIPLNDPGMERLQEAGKRFIELALEAIRLREIHPPTVPCATCTAACCRHPFEITLTNEDLYCLEALDIGEHIVKYPRPGVFGELAYIDKKPMKNPVTGETEQVCSMLHKDGYCSIHAHRPQVCRDWNPYACEMHVLAPYSLLKKRKKVWKEEAKLDEDPTFENVLDEYRTPSDPTSLTAQKPSPEKTLKTGAIVTMPGLSPCPWCNSECVELTPKDHTYVCTKDPRHIVHWTSWGG